MDIKKYHVLKQHECLKAVNIKITDSWDVTPCSLLDITNLREEPGAPIFRVQLINSYMKMEAGRSYESLVSIRLYGIISQKTVSQYGTSRFVKLGLR
jgi:hypothetical protein